MGLICYCYITLSFAIGFMGIGRKGGYWGAFILSVFITPVLAAWVLMSLVPEEPSSEDLIRIVKKDLSKGMISNTEYQEFVKYIEKRGK